MKGPVLMLTVFRQGRGWSRSELARRARMTPADVGKIESGRLVPYDSQLKKLARAFGLPAVNLHRLLDSAEPGKSAHPSHVPADDGACLASAAFRRHRRRDTRRERNATKDRASE